MNQHRRTIFLLCAMTLLCLLPFPALATVQTQTYRENETLYTVATFDRDFPAELNDVLDGFGFSQSLRQCGAMFTSALEVEPSLLDSEDPKLRKAAESQYRMFNYTNALCVLELDGVTWTVGLLRTVDNGWRMTLSSGGIVLPNRSYTLTMDTEYDSWLHPVFVFTYPRESGGSDRYQLYHRIHYDSYWCVNRYESVNAEGVGIRIDTDFGCRFYRVTDLPKADDDFSNVRAYTYYMPQFLAYGDLLAWRGVSDYPTAEADAKQLADKSVAALPENSVLIGGFVNLRARPTTSSASLGRYYGGTIGTLLQGNSSSGWLHVQVGATEGYVSTRYAVPASSYVGSQLDLVACPLPIGTVQKECVLMDAPEKNAVGKGTLAQGVQLQVMGAVDEQWLHVTLSQPGENMQIDADTGYLPTDAVSWVY